MGPVTMHWAFSGITAWQEQQVQQRQQRVLLGWLQHQQRVLLELLQA